MFRKAHYIALGTVFLLTVVVLKLPTRTATQFKLALGSLFMPFFGAAATAESAVGAAGNAILPRSELLSQNDKLLRENQELKVRLIQATEAERENERLRQMLNFQRVSPWKMQPAHVIARDPANWWRNVQINVGRRDGVREDLPVITVDGLVGRISEVGETRSQVVLIGDPNCRVSAVVHTNREQGVITAGATAMDSSLVELWYLPGSTTLKPGQLVMTSGLGGIFPKGIPVGNIVDFRSVEYGLRTEARVKLLANLSLLEEVFVLFP